MLDGLPVLENAILITNSSDNTVGGRTVRGATTSSRRSTLVFPSSGLAGAT